MRDIIQLACGECKRRNYSTTKNKKKTTERIELQQVLSASAASTRRTRSRSNAVRSQVSGFRYQNVDRHDDS